MTKISDGRGSAPLSGRIGLSLCHSRLFLFYYIFILGPWLSLCYWCLHWRGGS
jgi:hypothetical protein